MEEPAPRFRLDKVGHYVVLKTIGHGNFANVKLAKHEIGRMKVALKIIDKSKIDEASMIKIDREVSLLQALNHPHIVKLYEIMRSENYLYLCTEYCSNGELYEYVLKRGRLPENEAKRLFSQISCALQYLHQNRIVHRDLKVENILLDKANNIKIIDFGFSNVQAYGKLLTTWCGSPPYAAPELLLGKEYDGTKADIWSLGVILYILVTGGFPFPSETMDALKRAVMACVVKIPFFVSVECSDLIRKMLVFNPTKRCNINNVLQHRWLTSSPELMPKALTQTFELRMAPSATVGSSAPATVIINPTVLVFMQTNAKWTEKMIRDVVANRDFTSPIYGTYELLCDKVGRGNFRVNEGPDFARRGSRGSIVSGKVFDDTPPLTPTISAHQLASLYMSSSSGSEESDADSNTVSPRVRRVRKYKQFLGAHPPDRPNPEEYRRHSLCVSKEAASHDLVNITPFSHLALRQPDIQQRIMELLASQSTTTQPAYNLPSFFNFPTLPTSTHRSHILSVPRIDEKRSSISEDHLIEPNTSNIGNTLGAKTEDASIEDEGQSYLNKHGGKRYTVHGALLAEPSGTIRHSPYVKTRGSERRSSWASTAFSPQQLAQLEKLHDQAVGGNISNASLSIQALQEEFQQLGRITSTTGGNVVNISIGTSVEAPTSVMANVAASIACPRISITDEFNRSMCAPSTSGNPESLRLFEQGIESFYCPRPSTVIGFVHTPSETSTPDHMPGSSSIESDSIGKSFESTLSSDVLTLELKKKLHELNITFDESHESVDAHHTMCRLSIQDGLEIGVANLDETRTLVDFAVLSPGCSPRAEHIMNQLMRRLQECDPLGKAE